MKNIQQRYVSRKAYALMEDSGDQFRLTERETEFIQSSDSFYMATVGENGWPYVQFRGGPAGFLKIVDDTTLDYADFRGNRQYISTGSFETENRVALILMDYANQRRLKIWTEVTITEANEDPALIKTLEMPDYEARIERADLLKVQAFGWNCPQHITPRYTAAEFEQITGSD
ncbi:MAG: putative pyridoxine 5'-phosphate oxidase superfamily flavin-nucleotide-binding protein [Gammaproteobacteria bacterium]